MTLSSTSTIAFLGKWLTVYWKWPAIMLSLPTEISEAAAFTVRSWDHISRGDLTASSTPYDQALRGTET